MNTQTSGNADGHDSAIIRAFIRVKIRSSSVIPASSLVYSVVRRLAFWRSIKTSRRACRSSVNLNRLSPRTFWIWIPTSIQNDGCTIVWVIISIDSNLFFHLSLINCDSLAEPFLSCGTLREWRIDPNIFFYFSSTGARVYLDKIGSIALSSY